MYSLKRERLVVCEEVDVDGGDVSMTSFNEETEEDLEFCDEDPLAIPSLKQEAAEVDYYQDEEDTVVEDTIAEMKLLNPESMKQEIEQGDSNGVVNNDTKFVRRSGPRVFICTLCHVGFPNDKLYQEHMSKIHADNFPFPCRHCGKRFKEKNNRVRHETIHDSKRFEGEPKFACDLCDKKYHLKVSLVGHRKRAHLGYKPPKRPSRATVIEHHARGTQAPRKPKVKKEIPCPQCDLVFSMNSELKRHMLVHSSDFRHPCPFCDAMLKSHKSLPGHIKRVHKTESIGPRPSRPKSMAHQPCPCLVCGKVFRIPSQLKRHVTVHTGEKCHKCRTCGMDFRLKSDLYRHEKRHVTENDVTKKLKLNLYKCIYCGKDGFIVYSELRNHRYGKHRNIPVLDSEKEKGPFGCVICCKPWNTRASAIICSLYRHDPSSLLKTMFRFKCKECPQESLVNGYHSLVALRKHWSAEHPQLPIPTEYRIGMYNENLSDALPTVTIPKAKAAEVRDGSLFLEMDEEQVESLYLELDLVQVDEKFLKVPWPRRATKKREEKPKPHCRRCSLSFASNCNYRRHMKVKHRVDVKLNDTRSIEDESSDNDYLDEVSGERGETSSVVIESRPEEQKGKRSGRITKLKTCTEDFISEVEIEKYCDLDGGTKSGSDSELEVTLDFKCSVCEKAFATKRAAWCHELQSHRRGQLGSERLLMNIKKCEGVEDVRSGDFRCKVCEKAFPTKRAAWCHELQAHRRNRIQVERANGGKVAPREGFNDDGKQCLSSNPSSLITRPGTVNVNDQAGINVLLGWKEVSVKLFRITV